MDTLSGASKTAPLLISATIFVMTLSLFLDTPLGHRAGFSAIGAVGVSAAFSLLCYVAAGVALGRLFRRHQISVAEEVFRYLQVMTSCYVAFGNGANDVANAMAPLAGVYFIISTGLVAETSPVPVWMLGFGGGMICLGICTWGYRAIETMGSKITELTSSRGFTVDFSAATMILIASMLGLPVSTTHAAVGAFIGVALARGIEAEADRIKRNVRQHLPPSLLMPFEKSVFFNFLREADKMVDCVKNSLYWMSYYHLALPRDIERNYVLLVREAGDYVGLLPEMVLRAHTYFTGRLESDRAAVKDIIREIRFRERESDDLEKTLFIRLCADEELPPKTFFVMIRLVETTGDIADRLENSADMVRIMIAR